MKKFKVLAFLVLFNMLFTLPVFAAEEYNSPPAYIKLTGPNQSAVDNPVMADRTGETPTTFMAVYIGYKLQVGDNYGIRWYDSSDNLIEESRFEATSDRYEGGGMISEPDGAASARLFLESGSEPGVRYVWYNDAQNHLLNITFFAKPNTSDYIFGGGDPGGGDPGGGTGATNDDIIEAIRNQTDDLSSTLYQIRNSLNSMSGQIGDMYNQIYNMSNQLESIFGKLNSISGQLQTVTNQLNTVTGQLNTLNNTVNTMNNTLTSINDYLTTPRNAGVVNTNKLNPVPTFDPTPQAISDPAPAPYIYDRAVPVMPEFIDSPGPLPRNPDPIAMEHDDPISQDDPIVAENAFRVESPLSPEYPIPRQNPIVDTPLPRDPAVMDAPLPRDPVNMDQPITPQAPLTPSLPFGPQAPFSPETPFTPEPPLNP